MGRRGFTLLEMGFVVGVVGIIILFTANLSSTQHRLQSGEHRADMVVQDVLDIMEATWAWSVDHSTVASGWQWPYDSSTTLIDMDQLETDLYLYHPRTTRYRERCEPTNACAQWDYEFRGWDRDGTTAIAKLTDDPTKADDLVIKFIIAEERRIVDSIVARIPYGRIESTGTNNAGTPQAYTIYNIEARLFKENSPITTGSQFVGVSSGNITTVPSSTSITFDDGDMQGIRWMSREILDSGIGREDEPGTPLTTQSEKGGEVLAMLDGGMQIGTINDKNNWTHASAKIMSGYMEAKSESTEATIGAQTARYPSVTPTLVSVENQTKIGVSGGTPIWETIGQKSSVSTVLDPERRFRLEYKKGNNSWDMYFAYGESGHKSLQCRLCRLERLLDTYKADMSHDHANQILIEDLTSNTYEDYSCSKFTATYCGY